MCSWNQSRLMLSGRETPGNARNVREDGGTMSEPKPIEHTEPQWGCKCSACERRRVLAYERTLVDELSDTEDLYDGGQEW